MAGLHQCHGCGYRFEDAEGLANHVCPEDTPYPGGGRGPTSGHMGTDTSEARARADDTSGRTGARRVETLALLHQAGWHGLTWRELAERTGWHHGEASGALTRAHKAGLIERLALQRKGCKVYVLAHFVDSRTTEPYQPQMTSKQLRERLAQAELLLRQSRIALNDFIEWPSDLRANEQSARETVADIDKYLGREDQ